MNYESNLLHHTGVIAKRVCAAAAETAAHEGDDNTPSGPTGRGVKTHIKIYWMTQMVAMTTMVTKMEIAQKIWVNNIVLWQLCLLNYYLIVQ